MPTKCGVHPMEKGAAVDLNFQPLERCFEEGVAVNEDPDPELSAN